MLSAVISALHLLALAIGLPAVYLRGRALKGRLDRDGFQRLFAADSVWGVAAATLARHRTSARLRRSGEGLRLLSRLAPVLAEDGACFALVVALEIWPMLTLIRWRVALRHGGTPDTSAARALYAVTHVEMALVVVMVFVAAFMARGFGVR